MTLNIVLRVFSTLMLLLAVGIDLFVMYRLLQATLMLRDVTVRLLQAQQFPEKVYIPKLPKPNFYLLLAVLYLAAGFTLGRWMK